MVLVVDSISCITAQDLAPPNSTLVFVTTCSLGSLKFAQAKAVKNSYMDQQQRTELGQILFIYLFILLQCVSFFQMIIDHILTGENTNTNSPLLSVFLFPFSFFFVCLFVQSFALFSDSDVYLTPCSLFKLVTGDSSVSVSQVGREQSNSVMSFHFTLNEPENTEQVICSEGKCILIHIMLTELSRRNMT